MPTVGVYLNNSTYLKMANRHGINIGKRLSQLADADVFEGTTATETNIVKEAAFVSKIQAKKKSVDKKTGEITYDNELSDMMGGI